MYGNKKQCGKIRFFLHAVLSGAYFYGFNLGHDRFPDYKQEHRRYPEPLSGPVFPEPIEIRHFRPDNLNADILYLHVADLQKLNLGRFR